MLALPPLIDQVGSPPPVEFDRYLDGASRCFARYGLFRTSVQDIARELGVNRTTIYRQVGGVDDIMRLLAVRDVHRMLGAIDLPVAGDAPQMVVQLAASVVRQTRAHPVIAKLLADEPQIINTTVLADYPSLVDRLAGLVAAMLAPVMDAGLLARRDPRIVAEWLVRIVLTLVIQPPAADLEDFLSELLVPALEPPRRTR